MAFEKGKSREAIKVRVKLHNQQSHYCTGKHTHVSHAHGYFSLALINSLSSLRTINSFTCSVTLRAASKPSKPDTDVLIHAGMAFLSRPLAISKRLGKSH